MFEFLNQGFTYFFSFFVLIGLLIFVHEAGHFLVAKYFKVRVETFSLGFGKKIFQYKGKETTYCISMIPLGGYVKMFGDIPGKEIAEEDKKHAFLEKSVGARIAIVLAGPLMNLLFAIFLFTTIAFVGEKMPPPTLGDIKTSSAAGKAGFQSGSTIQSINGSPITSWIDVHKIIKESPNKNLSFKIKESPSVINIIASEKSNPDLVSTVDSIGAIEGLDNYSEAPVVGVINSNSIAAKAGFGSVDLITAVNGKKINFMRELKSELKSLKPNQTIQLEVENFLEEKPKTRTISLSHTSYALTSLGFSKTELFLSNVKPDSPADKAGLKKGDQILAVENKPITEWEELLASVKAYNETMPALNFTVARLGSENLSLNIKPEMTSLVSSDGADDKRYTIGIMPALGYAMDDYIVVKAGSMMASFKQGLQQSNLWTKNVAMSFVRMVQGKISSKNVGGLISIGKFAGQSYEAGISAFMKMMAILSINLFILNLLPIPILDGGHLVFYIAEAIKGAPVKVEKMMMAQQVGLVLLLFLMAFAFFNDITQLLNAW